jgi:hypothetical protein
VKLYPIPGKWRNGDFVSREQEQEQYTGAGEELLLRATAAAELRLCVRYSSLVHFNLNQTSDKTSLFRKRV